MSLPRCPRCLSPELVYQTVIDGSADMSNPRRHRICRCRDCHWTGTPELAAAKTIHEDGGAR